jgi:hypothetical protein
VGKGEKSPFLFSIWRFLVLKHNHHIIPKHMGGTDEPSNLVKLTIEEHAEAHRRLFVEYGHWQDEVAWKTLSGQMTRAEAINTAQRAPKTDDWKRRMSERMKGAKNPRFGKPGTMLGKSLPESAKKLISEHRRGTTHKAVQWQVTHPNGDKEVITNLTQFCRKSHLSQGSMILVSQGARSHHKGYTCKKLDGCN